MASEVWRQRCGCRPCRGHPTAPCLATALKRRRRNKHRRSSITTTTTHTTPPSPKPNPTPLLTIPTSPPSYKLHVIRPPWRARIKATSCTRSPFSLTNSRYHQAPSPCCMRGHGLTQDIARRCPPPPERHPQTVHHRPRIGPGAHSRRAHTLPGRCAYPHMPPHDPILTPSQSLWKTRMKSSPP